MLKVFIYLLPQEKNVYSTKHIFFSFAHPNETRDTKAVSETVKFT